jgi:hypothetical protein
MPTIRGSSQVGSGTEIATRTRQHENAVVTAGRDGPEDLQQVVPHLRVGCVLLGRAIHGDGDDPRRATDLDGFHGNCTISTTGRVGASGRVRFELW